MKITNFNYNKKKVTALCLSGNYLWIAFKGTGGNSTLYKVSAYNPYQRFYDITVPVNEITRIKSDGTYIYLAVDDDTYIGAKFRITNPLTNYNYISKPTEITEKSIDLAFDNTYLYLLTPGDTSGTFSKILKYKISDLTFTYTIELSKTGEEIRNSKSMTIDNFNNLYVVTYEDPAKLIKVETSGAYDFEVIA